MERRTQGGTMYNNNTETDLGFTANRVPIGTHMCLVFTDEEERKESLLKFLLSGIKANEKCTCFSEKISEETIREYFAREQISYDERKEQGAISLNGTSDVYFAEGRFDPDRMLNTLTNYYNSSVDEGYPAARVIGEMLPEVKTVPGGERLLEYESRVSMLVRDHPVTSVCQYDANLFDGATIMEVLKVHPKMIVKGVVINNPFFVEPEDYLKVLES